MVRPRVADGGDGLQIWRVVASILTKPSRTADKRWSSTSGLDGGLSSPHLKKKQIVTKCNTGPRISAGFCEYGGEPYGTIKGGKFLD
jgi:hypothetical protein